MSFGQDDERFIHEPQFTRFSSFSPTKSSNKADSPKIPWLDGPDQRPPSPTKMGLIPSPRKYRSNTKKELPTSPLKRQGKNPFSGKTAPVYGSKTYDISNSGLTKMSKIPRMEGTTDDVFYVFVSGTEPESIFAQGNKFRSFQGMPLLQNLRELYLDNNPICSFEYMKELPNLRVLSLRNTKIRSYKGAQTLKRLTSINLEGSPIVSYVPPKAATSADLAYRVLAFIAFDAPNLSRVDGTPLSEYERDDGRRFGSVIRYHLREGFLLRYIHNEALSTRERNTGHYIIHTTEALPESRSRNTKDSKKKQKPTEHQTPARRTHAMHTNSDYDMSAREGRYSQEQEGVQHTPQREAELTNLTGWNSTEETDDYAGDTSDTHGSPAGTRPTPLSLPPLSSTFSFDAPPSDSSEEEQRNTKKTHSSSCLMASLVFTPF